MKKNIIIVALVAIIAIMGSIIYKGYNNKEVTNNNNDNNLTNFDDDNTDNQLSKGNLLQFDTKFYDLKEIAKEYKKLQDVDGDAYLSYDLDGDGEVDQILFNNSTVKFKDQDIDIFDNINEVYIVDFNENDNALELVVYDLGPSADEHYNVYSKKGNKLEKVYSKAGDSLKCDKKGLVVVGQSYYFSPSIYYDYAYINNSTVENKYIDIEKIKNVDFSVDTNNSNWHFSDNYNNAINDNWYFSGNYKTSEEAGVEQVSSNITFKISKIEFINYRYVYHVTLSDGRVGYVFYPHLAG